MCICPRSLYLLVLSLESFTKHITSLGQNIFCHCLFLSFLTDMSAPHLKICNHCLNHCPLILPSLLHVCMCVCQCTQVCLFLCVCICVCSECVYVCVHISICLYEIFPWNKPENTLLYCNLNTEHFTLCIGDSASYLEIKSLSHCRADVAWWGISMSSFGILFCFFDIMQTNCLRASLSTVYMDTIF